MAKISVTYHAPLGDNKTTEMFGHTFHDGKAEHIDDDTPAPPTSSRPPPRPRPRPRLTPKKPKRLRPKPRNTENKTGWRRPGG
jgi:hypothetical protein